MKIVEILWFDAQSSLDAMTIEDMDKKLKPHLTKTIGYLAKETKDYLVVCFVDFGNGLFKHWQVIPMGMIKEKKVIKK